MRPFKPKDYQWDAVDEMVRGDYMLVWDPGTGKTWPVIQAAHERGYPHLAVVPAHLRDQWAEQATRFHSRTRVRILEKTTEPADLAGADFVICSYEYVTSIEKKGKTRIPRRFRELRAHPWRSMSFDEAHALTNQDAQRVHAMLGAKPESTAGLAFASKAAWFLSGTPFTFPNQIYPIVSRMFPGAIRSDESLSGYMTAREWENRFCVTAPVEDPRTGRSFGEKIVGGKNFPELRRRLRPYMSRVRLEDVHDGRETIDTLTVRGDLRTLLKGLEPEALEQYEVLIQILEDDEIPDDEKLGALDTSGLVMAQLRHHIAVAKIPSTLEILRLEREKGVDKILIFGWHRAPLKLLSDKSKSPLIYGGMPKRQKAECLRAFMDDPSCDRLFGQIGAIGTGTDGLQAVCRRSFFHEASWSYAQNKQARHRTHRLGGFLNPHTSFIGLKGSVDEHVARVLARNADTVARALD